MVVRSVERFYIVALWVGAETKLPNRTWLVANTPGVLAESELNSIASSSARNQRWTNDEIMCDKMVLVIVGYIMIKNYP